MAQQPYQKVQDPSAQDAAYPPPYPPAQGGNPYPPGQGAPPPGANPPPYQQPPQQVAPGAPVVVVPGQQVIVSTIKFEQSPVRMRCPNCNNDVLSNTTFQNGNLVWIAVLVLLVFGLWAGCCLIPLCISSLKDVDHTCPVCNYQLGKYERAKF